MKILALRVLAWDEAVRLPQRIDFIKHLFMKNVDYSEIYIQPTRAFGYYLGYILGFILTIPRLLRSKYDILLVENAYLIIFGFFSKLSRKKVIAEYVDYYPNMLQRIWRTHRFRFYVAIMLCRIFSNLADIVVVETSLSKQIVIDLGIHRSKVHVLSHLPDLTEMKYNNRQEIRAKYGISSKDFVVGYLGKIPDHYGLEFFPQAVASAESRTKRDLVLMMVGDGEYLSVLKDMSRELGLKKVIFPGRVPFKEVSKYYSAFDVLLFTIKSPSGIKLVEALAIGVPVIVAPGYGTDHIKNGFNGLVTKERDPEAYADKIVELEALSESELEKMRRRTRKFSHRQFTKVIRQYFALFNVLSN